MERHLKCFNKADHEPHSWTFLYDHPATEYICPGRKSDDDDSDR